MNTETRKSQTPKSLQIKEFIVSEIESGTLKPGDKVPSETQLAERFSASRMTVNRAVKELTVERRVKRVQGLGTFVADQKPLAPLIEIRSISQEIALRGGQHSCVPISASEEIVSDEDADRLGLPPRSRVFRLRAVHKCDGTPIQYEDRLVNPAFSPDFLEQDFCSATASDYLLKHVTFTEVEHKVDAMRPTEDMARLLEIGTDDPCLRLVRRTWSGDRVITYVQLVHPGDLYRLGGRFQGPGIAREIA
ncbi:UTRA domain-containing protein [Chachezhania antarctica]|uniref:UTRA domain-containing protein n=1 Tax=Chachezhania antarctica TaxID=2340860 RepID=UPI0013CF2D1A|nr:UTRA domain-containing protein [Chachezhania antarctica]|tara:strand:- start:8247 stop:8993 length:747 start_codon:yes stop_codon:yes gene_type:complete